ncbi:synaptotagmin-6 isoform 2-T2 [Pholidichthys leucotaenia]
MLTMMEYPGPMGQLSRAGELRMPFSDGVKYCILAMSLTLLLLALGILAWQIFRCCKEQHTTYIQQDTVRSDLLYSEEKPIEFENYSGALSTKVEDVRIAAHRLSRCLSAASSSLSVSSMVDEDIREQTAIKKVDGSVRFSVYYDQLQSRLVVTVLQVGGLQQHSETRSLQPFVKIRLMWAGSEGVELEGLKDEEVRDFDKFSRHTVLGEVRVDLGQLDISYPLELQNDLQIPQKDLVGEVLLSLKFLPTSQRLEVGLLKVRVVLGEMCSDAVLYARVSIQCNQCKLPYQKSSAVSRCLVTVFNEVLMFSLPESPLDQCKIMVSVYETHTTSKSARNMIGQFCVWKEKNSEDEHWTLMMHTVRQPVAMWHSLLI